MARVNYNESLYRVGYRPYNTNPFAAAHGLSGPRRAPEAQQQAGVFTRRGGYALRGLGALGAIGDGSIVSYQGTWPATASNGAGGVFAGPQDILNAVIAILNREGLIVLGQQQNAGVLNWVTFTPFGVALQIQVNTGVGGFAQAADITSIINNAVYVTTGQMPISGATTLVQAPAAAGTQPIPAPPAALTPAGAAAAAAAAGVAAPPTDVGTWLENNFWMVAVFAIGLVAIPPIVQGFRR